MKFIKTVALMLSLGAAGAYAHGSAVKMTFSGNAGASSIDLGFKDTTTGEDNFTGSSNLGQFTFRNVEAETSAPQPSDACSGPGKLYFTLNHGGGVIRFEDGSLLLVTLTEGADCIDLAILEAHCTRSFQITGGTGRFRNTTGSLMLVETLHPAAFNASGNPVYFASKGDITGSISGLTTEEGRGEGR